MKEQIYTYIHFYIIYPSSVLSAKYMYIYFIRILIYIVYYIHYNILIETEIIVMIFYTLLYILVYVGNDINIYHISCTNINISYQFV